MYRALTPIALGLLLVPLSSCNCGDRTLEEQPSYRIQPLCETYCSRVMACAYDQLGTVDFTNEEECFDACAGDPVWDRTCADENEAQLECMEKIECPDFARVFTDPSDSRPCGEEIRGYAACLPGEER